MKKLLGIALLVALSGSAYADSHGKMKAEYEALHGAAVAALDKAASVGGEWRDARDKKAKVAKCGDKKLSYLLAAECHAANGDYTNAIKNAEIAKFQGERGYEQAMGQKNAGPRH